ncbi:MAG TPA: hypothetical protein VJZ26_09540 [Blastocatellia bacterium]|nr:hypothetical protein [Blastocatellia bacterium]
MTLKTFKAIHRTGQRVIGSTFALLLILAIAVATAAAQDKPAENKPAESKPQQVQPTGREYLGPTADSIRPYRPYNRDPFKMPIKPPTAKAREAQIARLLGFPPIETRRVEFRQKVDQARMRDLAEPEPVTQYLVNELDVMGVFRDERGYGAFIKAQPTGTVLFIRNGARCYNGEVMRIEGDEAETGAKVMFREFSFTMEPDGKRTQQERMVAKAPTATPGK